MPNRILYEGILTSDPVNQMGCKAQLLFYKLILVHDDFGRFDARPSIVRARCYPTAVESIREADITRLLAEVQEAGLIALYEHDGKPYGLFLLVDSPRAKSSKFPDPPEDVQALQKLRGSARRCKQEPARAGTGQQVRPYSDSDSYSESDSKTESIASVAPEKDPDPPKDVPSDPPVSPAETELLHWIRDHRMIQYSPQLFAKLLEIWTHPAGGRDRVSACVDIALRAGVSGVGDYALKVFTNQLADQAHGPRRNGKAVVVRAGQSSRQVDGGED